MSKVVLLFPGQGSQKVGMGRNLAENFPTAKHTFEEVDEALHLKLSKICFEGPLDELTLTENTQPAILATSIAAFRVYQEECGGAFGLAMGHSLGEWSALCAVGALSLPDAARLVRKRGQAMQNAVPSGRGKMAAILGLEADAVAEVCKEASRVHPECQPANFNGGSQVVISGHADSVDLAMKMAKEKGAKRALPLKVSAPFHSSLMKPAEEAVALDLAEIPIGAMAAPVIANVDAKENLDPLRVKELLVKQVTGSVRWEESVLRASEMGFSRGVELGCGSVLKGLVRRIAKDFEVTCLGTQEDVHSLEKAAA